MLLERSHFRHVGSDLAMYQPLQYGGRANASLAPTPHLIYVQPFFTGRGGSIDQTVCRVSVATGSGTLRAAFYARTNSANLYPGALIADVGSADLSTTGTKTFSHAAIVVSANDLWWCAAIADDNVTLFSCDAENHAPALGAAATLQFPTATLTATHSFDGAWPATFPTSAAPFVGEVPQLAVRYNG